MKQQGSHPAVIGWKAEVDAANVSAPIPALAPNILIRLSCKLLQATPGRAGFADIDMHHFVHLSFPST